MAAQSTTRTDQHYVPQFLLRGFASNKSQLYVFDKSNGNEFRSSVRNLACQRDFYGPQIEHWLGKLEAVSAPLIQSIRDKQTLRHMQPSDFQWLAAFIAVQQVRTLHHRAMSADLHAQIGAVLREMGADPASVMNFRELSDSEIREHSNSDIARMSFTLLPYILKKDWILFSAATGTEFWIGDHPVTLANNMNPGDGLTGTLGFGVLGIEIYTPLSSKLMLGCLCPSIRAVFTASHEARLPAPRAGDFVRAFEELTPLTLDADNVKYHNSLQAASAERFVYSEHRAFEMVREMVCRDESFRTGRRVETVGRPKRKPRSS